MQLFNKPKIKAINETKCTCNVCGKIWHYGKKEVIENSNNKTQNVSKALMCCGGCLPAMLIQDKKVVDLNQCPNCGSKNVKCENVSYEVNQ